MAEEQKQEQLAGQEEEIRLLEQKLEEKKKELREQKEQMPEEKDLFREILREHIARTRTSSSGQVTDQQQTAVSKPVSDQVKKNAEDLEKIKEWEKQVEHLVKLALQGSVSQAVRAAEQATPYLLDELHDHLVDDYYEKLVALRKIKNL